MKIILACYAGGLNTKIAEIEPSDYIRQPQYRDEWQPAQSVTGKTVNKTHKIAIIVNEQYIDFI